MATSLLEGIGRRLWGFKPNLMAQIVEQHGAFRTLGWFVRNLPAYEKTLESWGGVRTHLVATEISVLNGCPYCTYGHSYALELHYLKATDRLLPVAEQEIVAWHDLPEAEVVARFERLLEAAELPSEREMLERLLALRHGSEPASPDDRRLAHLLAMFSFLNQCGTTGRTELDQAHDPINKDTALRHQYEIRRREVETDRVAARSNVASGREHGARFRGVERS